MAAGIFTGRCNLLRMTSGRPQHGLGLFTFALLFLSVAILNWGMQYKMSLYRNDGVPHVAVAKLLPGRDSVSSEATEAAGQKASDLPVPPTLLVFFLALCLLLRNCWTLRTFLNRQRTADLLELRLSRFRNSFFLRPPPAIIYF